MSYLLDTNIFLEILLNDFIPHANVLSLSKDKYEELNEMAEKHNMDFDDSYQTTLAKEYELTVITMDHDFQKVKTCIKVKFL